MFIYTIILCTSMTINSCENAVTSDNFMSVVDCSLALEETMNLARVAGLKPLGYCIELKEGFEL